MRHMAAGRKLSRDTGARQALLKNIAGALFSKGRLETTLAKAKFARPYVEKLITAAKEKKLQENRTLASRVPGDLNKLLLEIGPGMATRSGGYTRIVKVKRRLGDGSPMARLELLPADKKAITESTEKKEKAQKSDHKRHRISVPSKSSVPSVIKSVSLDEKR